MPDQSLASLCTEQSFIRSTFISDVFRANIILDNAMTDVDVERYTVPFTKAREAILREKYGLTDEDLATYYQRFSHGLRNGLNIITRLHKNEEFEATNGKSLVSFVFQKTIRTGPNSFEVYLLSQPMTRFLESDVCQGGKISFQMLVQLAWRLSLIIHKFNEAGVHIGAIDLDSLCMVPAAPGDKKSEYVTLTSFAYARSKDDKVVFPYQSVLPFSAHPSLKEGGQPNEQTDLYSLAAVITALANQTYGTDNISFDIEPNIYPEEFTDALKAALNGTIDSKGFNKMFNHLRKLPMMQSEGKKIEIPFIDAIPNYLDIEGPEEEEEPEQPEEDVAEQEEEAPAEEPEMLDMDFDVEPDTLDKMFMLPEDAIGD